MFEEHSKDIKFINLIRNALVRRCSARHSVLFRCLEVWTCLSTISKIKNNLLGQYFPAPGRNTCFLIHQVLPVRFPQALQAATPHVEVLFLLSTECGPKKGCMWFMASLYHDGDTRIWDQGHTICSMESHAHLKKFYLGLRLYPGRDGV